MTRPNTLDEAEWRDHIPSGYEDQSGYGHVSCSCGWDSSDQKAAWTIGWLEHIDAAYHDERLSRKDEPLFLSGSPMRAALLELADEMDEADPMHGPGLGEFADRLRALA